MVMLRLHVPHVQPFTQANNDYPVQILNCITIHLFIIGHNCGILYPTLLKALPELAKKLNTVL